MATSMKYLPASEFECRRKKRYPTQEAVVAGEKEARKRGAKWLHIYRCRYCEGYHIGHVTNWIFLEKRAAGGLTATR